MKDHNDFAVAASALVNKIGRVNGTKMLVYNDDGDEMVAEFVRAAYIKKAAEARYETAKLAIEQEFDAKISALSPGQSAALYQSTFAVLQLNYTNASQTLDKAALIVALTKRGFTLEDATAILAEGSKRRDGQKRYTGSFIIP